MTMENALEASGVRHAGNPTGFRRLTPGLLKADRTAESFTGLPDGVTMPGQLLAAFKAAAPRLGLSPRVVHAVDWLFRFTQPQDWGRGGRPIVWPSADVQQEALVLSETRVKAINRALIEAGLITMKDSPNGKRYGKRNPKGQIVEAYGFDLSPIAARHSEFVQLAAEAKAERVEMGRLRRRATIARKAITQILETVSEYGFAGEEWVTLRRESRDLTQALRKIERPEEMAIGVASLERRQVTARERLESLLAEAASKASESVNPDPLGAENGPHYYSYNLSLNPYQDTVMASEESKPVVASANLEPSPSVWPTQRQEGEGGQAEPTDPVRADSARTDNGTVLRIKTDELVRLAPRLRPYLRTSSPGWPDLVEAADWLRHDLGVSKSLWGDACIAMGREKAVIALAIVSLKPAEHFTASPGSYFHGMVARAKSGQLNLARTLWGLRENSDRQNGKLPHGQRKREFLNS